MRKQKATDAQLVCKYTETGNIWETAKYFDMCGQSVHERLKKIGMALKNPVFSNQEKNVLLLNYNLYAESGRLDDLAKKMGRTKQFICRKAGELNLTDNGRDKKWRRGIPNIALKKYIEENGHPKGMLGKTHTKETKIVMGENSKEMWKKMSETQRDQFSARASINGRKTTMNRSNASWKAGWREIGGIKKYYRSRWEANYARYLQFLITIKEVKKWEHEPETFWFNGIKRGCMSYLPDFRVEYPDGRIEYHEVKGWMDDRSKTKIARMAKYHPNVKLIVIEKPGYESIKKTVGCLIPDWE